MLPSHVAANPSRFDELKLRQLLCAALLFDCDVVLPIFIATDPIVWQPTAVTYLLLTLSDVTVMRAVNTSTTLPSQQR
jgi:hypothetical protein